MDVTKNPEPASNRMLAPPAQEDERAGPTPLSTPSPTIDPAQRRHQNLSRAAETEKTRHQADSPPAPATRGAGVPTGVVLGQRASSADTMLLAGPTVDAAERQETASIGIPEVRTTAATVPATDPEVSRGEPVSTGTVYGGRPVGQPETRRRRWMPPRLRIGAHRADPAGLSRVSVRAAHSGLLLGYEAPGRPLTVRLFSAEPTRLAVVGGHWIAQLLAFRAMALGARVIVFTHAHDQWRGFGEWATGRTGRCATVDPEQPVSVAASACMPVLLLCDGGSIRPTVPHLIGPWQTQVTILRQLTAYGFGVLQESALVAVQRLAAAEAGTATAVLRLPAATAGRLQALRDDMLALLGGGTPGRGATRYLWTQPTGIERQRFGEPRR